MSDQSAIILTDELKALVYASHVPWEDRVIELLKFDKATPDAIERCVGLLRLRSWTLAFTGVVTYGDSVLGDEIMGSAIQAIWGPTFQVQMVQGDSLPRRLENLAAVLSHYYMEDIQDVLSRECIERWTASISIIFGDWILTAAELAFPQKERAKAPKTQSLLSTMLLQVLRLHFLTTVMNDDRADDRRAELELLVRGAAQWPIIGCNWDEGRIYCLSAE